MRRCDKSRSKLIRDGYIELGEYIEINNKILKVFAIFLNRGTGYFYLAKLYDSSNHYFLVSELKKGNRKKYQVMDSFTGNGDGLKKSIDVMVEILEENKNLRTLERIK